MNDIQTFVLLPFLCSGLTYWGLSGFWFILDVFLAPRHRIPGGEIIDWSLYQKTAKHVLTIQSITPVILYAMIPLWKSYQIETQLSTLFTKGNGLKLCICPYVSDVVFYITHRICHIGALYTNVHKKHHEWVVPCALAASYTTIYEFVFCNLPVFLLPPLILKLHWIGAQLWFVFATIHVVNDHSGYVFLKNSIHHSDHHKYGKYNFATPELDTLLQTKKRHVD